MASKPDTPQKPRKRVLQGKGTKARPHPSLDSKPVGQSPEGDEKPFIHEEDLQHEDEILTRKQLAFVMAYVHGKRSASDAYEDAYDTSNMTRKQVNEEASKLLKHPKISQRIRKHDATLMRASVFGKAWVLEETMRLAQHARAKEQLGIAHDTMKMLGKTAEAGHVFADNGAGNGQAGSGAAGGLPPLDVWYREIVLVGRSAPAAESTVPDGPVRALEVRPEKE
jgi:hypothetical protein